MSARSAEMYVNPGEKVIFRRENIIKSRHREMATLLYHLLKARFAARSIMYLRRFPALMRPVECGGA